MRTTIDVVETQIDEVMPRADRPVLHAAIVAYSREVAFAAAEIYARAAELRGAWDARLEASVVDAVLRGETDETGAVSRLDARLALHRRRWSWWSVEPRTPALTPPTRPPSSRRSATRPPSPDLDMLGAVQGDRLVVVLGGSALKDPDWTLAVVGRFVSSFAAGPVVVGPPVDHLMDAAASTREALSGYRAAVGWPEAPRPVAPTTCCPNAPCPVTGTPVGRWPATSTTRCWPPAAGLLETLVVFLDQGLSVEAAARALFVHANTVRYRLRRIHEVTGYSPTDPRDAYALRLALTLGRLLGRRGRTDESGGD